MRLFCLVLCLLSLPAVKMQYVVTQQPLNTGALPSHPPSSYSITSDTDTTPPAFVSFVLSPTTIDITNSPQTVTVFVQFTDSQSGVAGPVLQWLYNVPNTYANSVTTCTVLNGTSADAWFKCTTGFPVGLPGGQWVLNLNVSDYAGNILSYAPANFASRGWPTLQITSPKADSTPPFVTHLSFSASPLTVTSAQTHQNFVVTLAAGDDIAGVAEWIVVFTPPSTSPLWVVYNELSGIVADSNAPSSGTARNGTWSVSSNNVFAAPPAVSGTWTFANLTIYDNVGNSRVYTYSQAQTMGWSLSVSVNQAQVPDITAAQLVDFAMFPSSFNVKGSSLIQPYWMNVTIGGQHSSTDVHVFAYYNGPFAGGEAELVVEFPVSQPVGSNTLFYRKLYVQDFVDWSGFYVLKGIIIESQTITQHGQAVRVIGACPLPFAETYGTRCDLSGASTVASLLPTYLLTGFLCWIVTRA